MAGITQAQREKFVRDVSPYAEEASRASGIDRNVIIAQAAHESAWGTKAKGNNYFGIKGKGQAFTTHEVINGKTVKMKQGFRSYANPLDSFMDWARLMTSKARYAPVVNAKTPEAQIAALGASGYATDPAYASKLRSITTRVKGMVGTVGDVVGLDGQVGKQTIRPGDKGEDVRALQSMLRSMGADIKVDGDYGPRTRAAVEAFQRANGLTVDGIVGRNTRPMLEAASAPGAPGVSLEARDEAAAARLASMRGAMDRYNAVKTAPKIERPAALTGTVESQPSGVSAAANMRLSPVDAPRLTGTTYSDPGASAEASIRLSPTSRAQPSTGNSPFAEPSFTNRGLPPGAQASEQQVADAKRKLGLELAASAPQRTVIGNPAGIDMAERRRFTPNQMLDAVEGAAARRVLESAPREDLAAMDARLAASGLTPEAMRASAQRQGIIPRQVTTERIPQNVPVVSGASATPVNNDAMSRAFDISDGLNYSPAAPKQDLSAIFNKVSAPSLPSRNVSVPQIATVSSAPMRTTDIPASMQPSYPKVTAAPLTGPLAGAAARYAGVQAQQAAPTYQPVAPMAAAPIPRPNPLANAPMVMGATAAPAQPPSALRKLAPGMIGMAMAGGPMGMLGGFARLAAASLGNVNNPRGLGFDLGTAAQNARVAAGVHASDMVGNGASYGRRQSDGSVTGTTSRGTGYTSRDNGREISIGGRTYEKKDRGYSLKV